MPTSFLRFELSRRWTVCYIIKLSDKPFEETQKMKMEKKGDTFEYVTVIEDLTVIYDGVFAVYLGLFSLLTSCLYFFIIMLFLSCKHRCQWKKF